MTLWTTHIVKGQHDCQTGFQGFNKLTLPGKPVEVARTESKETLHEEDAFAMFHRAGVKIEKHSAVSKLFNQDESVAGYMLSYRGVPEAFIMKVSEPPRKIPIK